MTAGSQSTPTPQVSPTSQVPHSIRGPLRYQITTSSPQLEAGTKFSIYTRITNPYDVPVKITSVTTLLPVEFIDVASLERTHRKQKILALINSAQSVTQEKDSFAFLKKKPPEASPSRMSTQEISAVPESDIVSISDPLSIRQLIRTSTDQEAAKTEMVQRLHEALRKSDEMGESAVILQPGNSVIQVFTLKTNYAIFFPPNIYQSSVRIEYEIDSGKNIDVADYQLNIRAPLKAILYGALAGSLFGFLLRDLTGDQKMMPLLVAATRTAQGTTQYLLSLATAMMIAGIVVVAFARKKDAQPILSVEDFWGGVFVGFLAGYSGKSYLEKTLGTGNLAAPTPTPPVK